MKILNAVKKIFMVESNQQCAKHKSNMRISWVSILVVSAVCLAACAISQNFADFTLENSKSYHQAYHQNPIIQTTNSASSAAFIQSSNVARYVLSSIRNARSRLYDDRSTYFNGVPLQDYVSRYGLTKEAYVIIFSTILQMKRMLSAARKKPLSMGSLAILAQMV